MNEKIIYTKRKDKKGRILHTGEFQLADGRYRFKYVDVDGKEKFAYSNRLDHNDATPPGKKRMLSLREIEKQIQADLFDHIVSNGGNMTVIELVRKYVDTKVGVRESTKAGMNPKTLQYLMGHADIGVTLNTYTHVNLDDAKEEVRRLRSV